MDRLFSFSMKDNKTLKKNKKIKKTKNVYKVKSISKLKNKSKKDNTKALSINNSNLISENQDFFNYIKKSNDYKFNNKYLNNVNYKNNFKKNIGLYDPLGENINPFTGKPYQNLYNNNIRTYDSGPKSGQKYRVTYRNLSYIWTNMAIYDHKTEILNSIRDNQVTLIKASTGVGKTVLIPKIALQAFNFQKNVICAVPKKVLVRSHSEFSATCLDVLVGNEVGYFFSGENKTNENTRLTFTTSGSLQSKITGSDSMLDEYQCVIIDEIHERSIETDFLILLIKNILMKKPNFRLVLMSATVDLSKFEYYFTKKFNKPFSYKQIDIEAQSFPVEEFFEPKPLTDWKSEAVNRVIKILKETDDGDILIFMKAAPEGKSICDDIMRQTKGLNNINPFCVVLEGKTTKDEQRFAENEFAYQTHPSSNPNKPYNRKIVIATNVAESSLTIKGVKFVIDNGYSFEASYYPKENARSLLEERISKASAKQRRGRAGRTKPGICYKLYTKEEFEKFPDYPVPDMQKNDLTSDILDFFLLDYIKSYKDLKKLLQELIDPPKEEFTLSSIHKLKELGAITSIDDNAKITDLGRALSKFRVIEPNFSKAILAGYNLKCMYDVINIILITLKMDNRIDSLFPKYMPRDRNMSNKEIEKQKKEYEKIQKSFHSSYGDLITIYNVYESLKKYMRENPENDPIRWCKENNINSKIFIRFKKSDQNKNMKKWDLIKESSNNFKKVINKIIGSQNLNLSEKVLNSKNELFSNSNSNKSTLNGGSNGFIFKDINIMDTRDKEKNIILAFCIGGVCNLVKIIDKKNHIYGTCFPQEKVKCRFDMNSTLSKDNATQIILYNELFKAKKDQNVLKLNIVSKIPQDVLNILKKYYKNAIDKCSSTELKKLAEKKVIKKKIQTKPFKKYPKKKSKK